LMSVRRGIVSLRYEEGSLSYMLLGGGSQKRVSRRRAPWH
jgi:hypothetical protein